MQPVIIIPSLNPASALVSLVADLVHGGAETLLIVNDGSGSAYRSVFEQLESYAQVKVLTHPVNQGKGAALKTAFRYCLHHYAGFPGVVTADDDGQHAPEDVLTLVETLSRAPDRLILGVRCFDKATTPKRSFSGNKAVNYIFRLLYGLRLTDSQTGLRGIPMNALPWMLKLSGMHYEFETHMLIEAARRQIIIEEIPIQHLYFDNNKATHYKMIRDSFRITGLMLTALFSRPKPYGALFYFTRFILRLCCRRLTVEGFAPVGPPAEPPVGPVIYIARHRNLKGVLDIMLWFDQPVRVWVLDVFCSRKRCFDQYARYTLTQRFGWPRWLAYPAAFIFSLYVPALMRSMRAVPVYRHSMRQMKETLEQSTEALCLHESLVIFPDVEYDSESGKMGKMYTGFVNLDKLYNARSLTERHISFVPLLVNEEKKTIQFGREARVNNGEAFASAKKRVCEELHAEFSP